jgi:hypothetical protein
VPLPLQLCTPPRPAPVGGFDTSVATRQEFVAVARRMIDNLQRALNQAVWQERDDVPIAERLEPFKTVFLAAARRSLGSSARDASEDNSQG